MQNLNDMLKNMVKENASDMHLTVGSPIKIRINGELKSYDENKLTPQIIRDLLKEYLDDKKLTILNSGKDIDFSIGISGISRFRVNIFKQRSNLVATFRRLPHNVPDIQTLGLPEKKWVKKK